jgi:hypothetical protein
MHCSSVLPKNTALSTLYADHLKPMTATHASSVVSSAGGKHTQAAFELTSVSDGIG